LRLRSILILLVILVALGGYFYFTSQPESPPPKEPQLYVWLIDDQELEHIVIELPREDKNEAFVKEADKSWHFDDDQRSNVDMERWGGGIPLLLSGPGTNRIIADNASEAQLAEFGLIQPQMKLVLTLENGEILNIKVGDVTPDGNYYYIQVPDSNSVALVDFTWYLVLERLVLEPPHITESSE